MKAKLLLASLVALVGAAPSLEAEVSFEFGDVENFRDFSVSGLSEERTLPIFEREFSRFLRVRGDRLLGEDRRLEIRFLDIDMAGDIQPWRSPRFHDIRFIEPIYPPYLKFEYRLLNADGQVLKEGEESIRDLGFDFRIRRAGYYHNSFYYEIELFEDWLRKLGKN